MNAPLPQPTNPNKQTLKKGVSQQVGKTPITPAASPISESSNYKSGQLPPITESNRKKPEIKPIDLNKPPVGVVVAKPATKLNDAVIKPLATPAVSPTNPIKPTIPVMPLKPTQAPTSLPQIQPQQKIPTKTSKFSIKGFGKKAEKTAVVDQLPKEGQPKTAQASQPKPIQPKQPFMARLSKIPKKTMMMIAGGIIIVILVGLGISSLSGGADKTADKNSDAAVAPQPTRQTVVTYWGLWEPSAVLEEVLSDFEKVNPGVKIDYRVQSHRDYRERLQTAIASGNGPDIFRYHATWVPMLTSDLAVMPTSVMSAAEFKASFYPSASELLQVEGKIVGIPLMYDGLGLYYNKEVLATAGVEPPETWAELKQLADELTVPSDKKEREGGLQRGGLAIGNASNVEHYSDILGLLILQNGGDPFAPSSTEVKDALTFYTNFISQDNIWDSSLPSSTVAFARGEAVMMFAPSWRAHEVMELNPELDFGIATLPQLSEEKITWSNYWAEGVNEKTKNKAEAWSLLKYLSSTEVMKKLYSAQAQTRSFGEPYSRVELAGELANDPYVSAILDDANYASGFYMSSFTHDNGINDLVNEYYVDAINTFLQGKNDDDTLITLEKGVNQVLSQY